MQEEAGRWISVIGVESLGGGDEPDTVAIQFPEIGQAIEQ